MTVPPYARKQLAGRARGAPLGDPVARKTEWEPMNPRGWNIRSRQFVEVSGDRCQFKPTIIALLLSACVLSLGGIALIAVVSGSEFGSSFWLTDALLPLAALAVFGAGLCVLYSFVTPIVFDVEIGHFWRGPLNPKRRDPGGQSDWAAKLGDIHAVQTVPKFRQGTEDADGDYYGCELNLVLHNARRVHVLDHNSYSKLSADAARLARFLDVPVWDGS